LELHRQPLLWKPMIDQGSKVFRQDNGPVSAMRIIQYLIDTRRPVVLDIQREMVDQKMQLGQTGAGSEVATEVEKAKQYYDKRIKDLETELRDALSKQDHERREEIEDTKKEFQSKLLKGQDELKRLQADTDELHEEMKKRYEKDIEEMKDAIQQKEVAIREADMKMTMLQETHAHDLEMQKLQLQIKEKEKYFRMLYGSKCVVM
jgi:predicted nuclease with TOPRIM domain